MPRKHELANPDLWTAPTLRNGLRTLAGTTREPRLAAAALIAIDLLDRADDEAVRESAGMVCLDGHWPYEDGTDA